MIYDIFDNAGQYFAESDPIYKAIKYVIDFDHTIPDGKYEVNGRELFAKVATYDTSPAEQRKFENHKDYIDVQIILSGKERMDVSIGQKLEPVGSYDEIDDVTKYMAPDSYTSVAMVPGMFVVFFPQDIHRPNCNLDETSRNRKICMKVRL